MKNQALFSSESSARQRIHMQNQALFSLTDKSKHLNCCLLQFLFGASRLNMMCKICGPSCILRTRSNNGLNSSWKLKLVHKVDR